MNYPNCQKFGFTQSKIDEMMALLELSEKDHDTAEILHRAVLRSKGDEIVEQFYTYLQQHREYMDYFKAGEQLTRMVDSQQKYLASLGVNFHSPGYFERCLQIGVIHNQIGLPPRLYECAYNKLKELIIEHIPQALEEEYRTQVMRFLNRIIALDTALALEGYHQTNEYFLKSSIADLEQSRINLERHSQQDTLTGAMERSAILSLISQLIFSNKNTDNTFSVVMCNIDNLKEVNDDLGRLAGDLVLKKYIELIQSRIRSNDHLGRYGGAMFMIVLPATNENGAESVVKELSNYLSSQDVVVGSNKVKLSVSYGITEAKPADNLQTLLMRLDKVINEN